MEEFNNDDIHMCRTCGIFYSKNFLREIFNNPPIDEITIMMHRIRLLMTAWKIEVNENDGRSDFMCTLCINEFERTCKFLDRCLEVHEEYTTFFANRHNLIQVKKELPEEEEKQLGFIYIDDVSDDDDGQYEGSMVPSFDISQLAFKEEKIEEARVPPPNPVNSRFLPITSDTFIPFAMMQNNELIQNSIATATTIPFADMTNDNEKIKNEQLNAFSIDNNNDSNNSNDDTKIVKFTYDDDIKDTYTNSIDIENAPIVGIGQEITSLTCKLCLYVAVDQAALREHFQRIHEIKDFDCYICGKKFKNSTSSRLRYHLKWHKLNKHVQCVLCGFNCASRDILNEHKRAVHSKIECNICNRKIYAKRLKGHLRAHELTAERSFHCSICNEAFEQQYRYESHILLAHGNGMVENSQTKTLSDDLEQDLESKLSLLEGSEQFSSFSTHSSTIPDETSERIDLNNDSVNDLIENNKTQQEQQQEQQQQQHSYAQLKQQTPNKFTSPRKEEISLNDINSVTTTIINGNDGIFSVPKTPLKEQFNLIPNQTYACAKCTECFSSIDDLLDHSEMHKRNSFQCELCEKSFDLKFKLNRHIMKQHKDDKLVN